MTPVGLHLRVEFIRRQIELLPTEPFEASPVRVHLFVQVFGVEFLCGLGALEIRLAVVVSLVAFPVVRRSPVIEVLRMLMRLVVLVRLESELDFVGIICCRRGCL